MGSNTRYSILYIKFPKFKYKMKNPVDVFFLCLCADKKYYKRFLLFDEEVFLSNEKLKLAKFSHFELATFFYFKFHFCLLKTLHQIDKVRLFTKLFSSHAQIMVNYVGTYFDDVWKRASQG